MVDPSNVTPDWALAQSARGGRRGPIVSIILAAGEGRRMGVPKAMLRLDAQTSLLARVINQHREAGVDECLVVLGAAAEQVWPLLAGLPARGLINPQWAFGQTSSLQVGIRALPPDATFLIAPLDQPGARVSDLRALIAEFERAGQPASGIVRLRSDGRGGHPVLFGPAYQSEFLALGENEPGHLVYRRHQGQVAWVDVDNPHLHADLDTPDDFTRWKESVIGGSSRR